MAFLRVSCARTVDAGARGAARSALLAAALSGLALAHGGCATGGTVDASSGTTTRGGGATSAGAGGDGGAGGAGAAGGASSQGGATSSSTGSGGVELVASACPPGSFATGLTFENKVACAPLAPAARDAINDGCDVYLGWRDGCTGCTLPPTKWGHASPKGCENGVGVDDTCTTPTLDGTEVQLFGLNFDGDVNNDDKIHLGFHCPAAPGAMVPGPCGVGSFATSLGAASTCVPAAAPVLDHVRTRCGLYFGWRDACDGCTSAPDRWGQVGPTGCTIGLGDNSTCTQPTLGAAEVQLFGLSLGGDVDGNDKLYMALHCDAPQAASSTTKGACPAGQLVTAIGDDGSLTCESPAKVVADYFDAHCTMYFGWRDGCNGCTDPPGKWGRVRNGFCTNDNGVDNTCTQTVLGGKTLEMLGINTDGDVNNDDKLYVGFRCE